VRNTTINGTFPQSLWVDTIPTLIDPRWFLLKKVHDLKFGAFLLLLGDSTSWASQTGVVADGANNATVKILTANGVYLRVNLRACVTIPCAVSQDIIISCTQRMSAVRRPIRKAR